MKRAMVHRAASLALSVGLAAASLGQAAPRSDAGVGGETVLRAGAMEPGAFTGRRFATGPHFICSGAFGEPARPLRLTVCGVFRAGRDLRARRFPGSRPHSELLFTGCADLMRDVVCEEEDRRVAARVNALLFNKGRKDPFLPCDGDAEALPLSPMARAAGTDALGLAASDFWAVALERRDSFDPGLLAKHLHRRATPIDRGLARLGAEALRNYVKPYVNSAPGERFRLDERFLGGAAIGGVLYYRPGMAGWGFSLGVFTPLR